MPQTLLDEFLLSLLLLFLLLLLLLLLLLVVCGFCHAQCQSQCATQTTWLAASHPHTRSLLGLIPRNAKIATIQAQLDEIRVFRAHQTAPPATPPSPLRSLLFSKGVGVECRKKQHISTSYPRDWTRFVHRAKLNAKKRERVPGKLRLGKIESSFECGIWGTRSKICKYLKVVQDIFVTWMASKIQEKLIRNSLPCQKFK